MSLISFEEKRPHVDPSVFVAENATLIGNVTLKEKSSVWFGSVLRADSNAMTIGARSNVQELSVFHVDGQHALTLGEGVTIGHRCILHGCTVEDGALIGMGSILMNGVHVGKESL